MNIEQVLSHPPRVLSQVQREAYFEQGYLCIESLISEAELQRLREVTQELLERSCQETASGSTFDLAPSHSSDAPKIRRIKRPDAQHDVYWQFSQGTIADVGQTWWGQTWCSITLSSTLSGTTVGTRCSGIKTSSSIHTPTTVH